MKSTSGDGVRVLAGAACALIAIVWGGRSLGPGDVPGHVDAEPGALAAFDTVRAMDYTARFLRSGAGAAETPHPAGSAEHAAARTRLIDLLRELGLAPELQQTWSAGPYGGVGQVVNVLAWLPPGPSGGAAGSATAPGAEVETEVEGSAGGAPARLGVALVAHYDSQAVAPGAADDASGVGIILEVARRLLREGPRHRPVLLLFTDAEEDGLLGAQAFVDQHPAASRLEYVVNLEARGTCGPSVLFETAGAPGPLLAALAAARPRALTSSFFTSVYARLPNDTDFTVFRAAGLKGANLAFIGGVQRYHTPLDALAYLDARSVHHQGVATLALARSLAALPPGSEPAGGHAFFGLAHGPLVSWPTPVSLPLALAALALAGWAAWRARRRAMRVGRAAVGWLLALGCVVVLGMGVQGVLRAVGVEAPWAADMQRITAVHLALLGAAALAVRWLPLGALEGRELALGAALVWTTIGVLAAVLDAAGCIPWVITALGVGLCAPAQLARGSCIGAVAAGGALLAVALVWLPVALLLRDGMGWGIAHWSGLALVVLSALPLVPALRPPTAAPARVTLRPLPCSLIVTACAVLGGAGWIATGTWVDASHPRALNLACVAIADEPVRWALGARARIPAALDAAARGCGEVPPGATSGLDESMSIERPLLPWSRTPVLLAPAFGVPRPAPPVWTLESVEPRVAEPATNESVPPAHTVRVRGRLRSERDVAALALAIPAEVRLHAVRIAGCELPLAPRRAAVRTPGWRVYRCIAPPAEGLEVELEFSGPLAPCWLVDLSRGLPAAGAPLAVARGLTHVPEGGGDVTIAARPIDLLAP